MDKINHLDIIITLFTTMLASSGFWYFVNKRIDSRQMNRKLLMGLAHDRIIYLCLKYIERGEITQDEHENLYSYLYEPYKDLGGNGSAIKLMEIINKLPICKSEYYTVKRKRRTTKNETLEQGL